MDYLNATLSDCVAEGFDNFLGAGATKASLSVEELPNRTGTVILMTDNGPGVSKDRMRTALKVCNKRENAHSASKRGQGMYVMAANLCDPGSDTDSLRLFSKVQGSDAAFFFEIQPKGFINGKAPTPVEAGNEHMGVLQPNLIELTKPVHDRFRSCEEIELSMEKGY